MTIVTIDPNFFMMVLLVLGAFVGYVLGKLLGKFYVFCMKAYMNYVVLQTSLISIGASLNSINHLMIQTNLDAVQRKEYIQSLLKAYFAILKNFPILVDVMNEIYGDVFPQKCVDLLKQIFNVAFPMSEIEKTQMTENMKSYFAIFKSSFPSGHEDLIAAFSKKSTSNIPTTEHSNIPTAEHNDIPNVDSDTVDTPFENLLDAAHRRFMAAQPKEFESKTPYNSPNPPDQVDALLQCIQSGSSNRGTHIAQSKCESDSDASQSSFENLSEENHTNVQTDHL